jgi:hypothetical protein
MSVALVTTQKNRYITSTKDPEPQTQRRRHRTHLPEDSRADVRPSRQRDLRRQGHLRRLGHRQAVAEGEAAEGAELPPHLHPPSHHHRFWPEGDEERVSALRTKEARWSPFQRRLREIG